MDSATRGQGAAWMSPGHIAIVIVLVFIAGLLLGVQVGTPEQAGPVYDQGYYNDRNYNESYPQEQPGHEDGNTSWNPGAAPSPGIMPGVIGDLRFNPPSINVEEASVAGSWDYVEKLIIEYASGAAPRGVVYYATGAIAVPEAMPVEAPVGAPSEAVPVTGEGPAYFEEGNFQVTGVRELDYAAFNGTHIVVASRDSVSVYRVYPADSMELVASLDLGEAIASRAPSVEVKVIVDGVEEASVSYTKRVVLRGVLLADGRIIVLGQVYYAGPGGGYGIYAPVYSVYFAPGSMYPPVAAVAILDNSLGIIDVYTVNGYLEDARLTGDSLAIAVRLPSYTVEYGMVQPVYPKVNGELIPADSVVVVGDPQEYLTVVAVNASSLEYSVLSLLGVAGRGYIVMDTSGIVYAAFNSYEPVESGGFTRAVKLYSINASPSGIELMAEGVFEGWLRSSWQLQPYSGYLILLTGGLKVDLYVLDPATLEPVSRIESLTEMEQVYGVRILDGILYMVTFRQVDPLFAINITDPESPLVLGYLKAPGFDNYLHPVGGGLILGVGVEDGRVRISLYKLENGTPVVVDRLYTGYQHTLLLAEGGHKAFAYNSMRGIALVPVQFPLAGDPMAGYLAVKVSNDTLTLLGMLDHACASRAYTADTLAYTVRAPQPGSPVPVPYEEPRGDCPVIVAWSLDTLEEVASIQGAGV
ncbi:MAG: beta-propeller domain-containing protein [Desulfurococcales archaeon]|nr:beta-propeller domain-containing protein [Desulfurococcales archaeon]